MNNLSPIKKILLVALFSAFSLPALSSNSIVAVIDDTVITLKDITSDSVMTLTKSEKLELIHEKIDLYIKLKKIKELGIEPKESAITAALGDIAIQNKLTLKQLRASSQFKTIAHKIIQEFSLIGLKRLVLRDLKPPKPTHQQILAALAKKPAEVAIQSQIKIAQITINSIKQSDSLLQSQDTLMEEKLRGIRQQIVNGKPFAELATQHSQDPFDKKQQNVDWVNTDNLSATFKKNLPKLEKNELSQPFKQQNDWKLIKIIDAREVDARYQLFQSKLIGENRAIAYQKWFKKLKDAAYIEIFEDKL